MKFLIGGIKFPSVRRAPVMRPLCVGRASELRRSLVSPHVDDASVVRPCVSRALIIDNTHSTAVVTISFIMCKMNESSIVAM